MLSDALSEKERRAVSEKHSSDTENITTNSPIYGLYSLAFKVRNSNFTPASLAEFECEKAM